MSFKLYELTQQYQELLDYISDSEADPQDFMDTLESINDVWEDKMQATAIMYKTLKAQEKAYKDEEDRLRTRRQAMGNNAERLKQYMQDALEAVGRTKVEGGTFTLRVQKNPVSVLITDDKAIPGHYLTDVAPAIDKKGLLEDLKNGIYVEGAELKQTNHLRIL